MARLDLQNDPTKHKLYTKWSNMVQRCSNKNDPRYHAYGGRGIKVCNEWVKFDNFYKDMFMEFRPGLTLDRIDTNQNYSKYNCRWVTQKVQQNNRTNNRKFTYFGMTKTLAEWADYLEMKHSTFNQRFHVYKWPIEKIMTRGIYGR